MTKNYLDILADTIRNNWDQPALTDFYLTEDGSVQDTSRGNHYSYGEMYMELCRVAELLTSLGLKKGDHIAICGANSAHWAIAYLAIAKMQGVSVTVMHTLMPDEIARLVAFSDAKALFTDEDIWEELRSQSIPQAESVIGLENWQVLRGEKAQTPNRESKISNRDISFPQYAPDSLAMICFTSGTSGIPKGVMLSYKSIAINVVHGFQEYEFLYRENIYSFIPFAHIYGLVIDIIQPLCRGMNVIISKDSFTIDNYISSCQIIRPIMLRVIPTVVYGIIDLIRNNSSIKGEIGENIIALLGGEIQLFCVGGAGMSYEFEKTLKSYKLPIVKGYGMTECGPRIADTFYSWQYKIGSVGKVVPTLTALISPAGEILVKGENVMLGYYKDPEATSRKIDSDGWLHTGDKGYLDEDGYLYVEGRLEQDIIVLPNGENIHPEDIERKINALPEVKESIVLARDGKLVAIAVPQISNVQSQISNADLRRKILRAVNPSLPLFSQLYDVEITDQPLARTEKQTIKRYLYK